MAKRGRKPKNKVLADLDVALQREIDEAIRSHADESSVSVYRRFGLHQRGLVFSTFRKHVRKVRLDAQGERVTADYTSDLDKMSERKLIGKLRRRILVEANEGLEAGDTKLYEQVALLSRLQEFDRIDFQRQANERAAELHEEKMTELRDKQVKALEDTAASTELTADQVKEIRRKVLGLA